MGEGSGPVSTHWLGSRRKPANEQAGHGIARSTPTTGNTDNDVTGSRDVSQHAVHAVLTLSPRAAGGHSGEDHGSCQLIDTTDVSRTTLCI